MIGYAYCKRKKSCPYVVQNGLAKSPAEIYQQLTSGSGVKQDYLLSDDVFQAGESNCSFKIDPVLRKGFSHNDAWELEQQAKRKLGKLHTDVKKDYDNKKNE